MFSLKQLGKITVVMSERARDDYSYPVVREREGERARDDYSYPVVREREHEMTIAIR